VSQWSLRERLQPSLLDRLTDEHPDRSKESAADAVLDQGEIKAAVVRDLAALLNCVSLEVIHDLEDLPRVQDSVLNYGILDLSGHTASSMNPKEIETAIKHAIHRFEPRLIRNSLRVRMRSNSDEMSANTVIFEIEGAVFGQPAPFQVSLRSELDLENGDIRLREGFV